MLTRKLFALSLLLTLLLATAVTAAPQAGAPAAAKLNVAISPLETHVLGESRWLRGGPAALRVIVDNHITGKPISAAVTLSLVKLVAGKPSGHAEQLYTGHTNALGTLDAQFQAPAAGSSGAYQLGVNVHSSLGDDQVDQPIQIAESTKILLTADKPVYQPGQVIHLRALTLDLATRRAVTNNTLVFEVEDARGNKVFKQREDLSRFGVASVDFQLADEVNMGTFTLRAIVGDEQEEKKVQVSRYVLPKFKVSLKTDKSYYLPGEQVSGTVDARYFFGKPVSDGKVTIHVSTIDIGVTELGEVEGSTDAAGAYKFQYRLPNSFVGQPFEQGKAVVEFAATVKDTADHPQDVHTTVPVVKDPIVLAVVPENKTLVPGLPNRLYIAAATPDGQPLRGARVTVSTQSGAAVTGGATVVTDGLGLATYTFTPPNQTVVLHVQAVDDTGRTASMTQDLSTDSAKDGLILRVDRTLAKVGDSITLDALSTIKRGTMYFDVLRDKQTILTQSAEVQNGRAQVRLNATADMTGTLEVHAYQILPSEDIIRDSRIVVVSPADDLSVQVTADKKQYRPGGDAVLRFTVLDNSRHGVSAALGVAIVDESVFALSELRPGLEKIYFTLEKELMEPRYEIHGLTPVGLIGPSPVPILDVERQRAAAMVLAAAPEPTGFDFKVNTYQTRWEKVRTKVVSEMVRISGTLRTVVQKFTSDTGSALTDTESLTFLAEKGYLQESQLKDPWGNFYRSNLYGRHDYNGYWTISSAGPDGRWGTADDITDVSVYGDERMVRAGAGGMWHRGIGGGMMEDDRDGDMLAANGAVELAAAPPMAAPMIAPASAANITTVQLDKSADAPGASAAPRIREYFPETMYWNPALITDGSGRAEVRVPVADSITTWRISMTGSSAIGELGSATAPLQVFQDFFVDIDLPTALTQHDSVEIPVAVYNYLPQAQDVTLTLADQPWFTREGPAEQKIHVEANQVTVVRYPITVNSIGSFALTVTAHGTHLSDAVRRTIDVLPNGKEVRATINDRLDGAADKTITFPDDSIEGARSLWVKLYPGTFSQVVEGLDGLLQMPGGCFEQTSSTTYPDVLVLDYLKQTKHINPELQMKAEAYINVGYQRLVTFECKSGGFSWFGDEPAHQVLTAYGLLEFSDMAKVHDVDPALIERTQRWLAGKQKGDGSWEETNHGIEEGIINRQTGALRTTAYVAWALAESGYTGPELARGVAYVEAHRGEAKDAYTLAVILNLLVQVDHGGAAAANTGAQLIALATVTDKTAYWKADTQTFTGAEGQGADMETTGLAAYALAQWGHEGGFLTKVLTYLVQSKNSFGVWGSTQGTVWSLKALLFAGRNSVGGGAGTVTIVANGVPAATVTLTADNSDVMRQIDLAKFLKPGANDVALNYKGEGSLLYQIVGRYYLPWDRVAPDPGAEPAPLTLAVAYDKTTLAQDDTATVKATIHNNTPMIAEMPLIDLGLPPGFTPQTADLDTAVQNHTISKYTVAARQIIVYMEKLDPGQTVTLTYQIKAKYPIDTKSPASKAYPYYNPERTALSVPQRITVTGAAH